MVLKVDSRVRGEELSNRIAESVRDVTKLRADVEWVDADGLPNDGKVIDDIHGNSVAFRNQALLRGTVGSSGKVGSSLPP
ncbi:hypothetical protein G6F68_020862 [Rhizopus microsporus]|nr:hypothetical protein G6F68_020862 [Rhizopus microsporus]